MARNELCLVCFRLLAARVRLTQPNAADETEFVPPM